MAENRESTILDVKLDAGKVAEDLTAILKNIAKLKEQQAEYNKIVKDGKDVNGEYAEKLLQVKDQLSWNEKQAKSLSATTKLLNSDTKKYGDTLNDERQKLADMQKAYAALSAEQRNSEGGKAFLKSIKEQSDAVKEMESAMGDNRRNVGNYTEAILKGTESLKGMFKAMKEGKNPMDSMKLALNAIGKTPVLLILDTLIKIVLKLSEKFKGNAAAMESLTKVFGLFNGVGVIVDKLIDALAKGFGWLADKLMQAADAMGLITDEMRESQRLAQGELELSAKQRDNARQNAEDMQKIADLRAKANEKDKVGAAERLRLLQEASDMEEAIAKRNADLAREAYELQVAKNAQSESSQEDLQKENDLYIEMISAQTSYLQKQREINGQMATLRQQQANEAKAAAKARADEEKRRLELQQQIAQEAEDFAVSLIQDETARAIAQRQIQGEREIAQLQQKLDTEKNLTAESRDQLAELIRGKQEALNAELEQMATDAANKLTEEQVKAEEERARRILEYKAELAEENSPEELEIQKQLLDLQMQQELEALNLTEEEKYLIRETFAKKAEELDKQYHDNLVKQAEDARQAYKSVLRSTASEASKTFGAMSDMLNQYGEENEDARKAAKAFGIAQIITDQAISIADTAKAITAAVAGATEAAASTGPAAPFLLAAYIASMVGAVLGAIASVGSSIASAKQLMAGDAGKYEHGGTIPGTSYTGDKLIAHVNSGEGIYTGTQANNLLQEIANNPIRGGFDYEAMGEAMAYAVAQQPAPVMDYQEFTDFQQKVSTYNEIAKV